MLMNTSNDKKSSPSKDQKSDSKKSGCDEDLPAARNSSLFVIHEDDAKPAHSVRKQSQRYLHEADRLSVNSEEDEELRRNEVSNQLKNISPIKFLLHG